MQQHFNSATGHAIKVNQSIWHFFKQSLRKRPDYSVEQVNRLYEPLQSRGIHLVGQLLELHPCALGAIYKGDEEAVETVISDILGSRGLNCSTDLRHLTLHKDPCGRAAYVKSELAA
jgi:hypothetical protein